MGNVAAGMRSLRWQRAAGDVRGVPHADQRRGRTGRAGELRLHAAAVRMCLREAVLDC